MTTERNYLAEAGAIVKDDAPILPEREHLLAVSAEGQRFAEDLLKLSRILAALTLDQGQSRLYVPPQLVKDVLAMEPQLTIEQDTYGGFLLTILVLRDVRPGKGGVH